MSKAVKGVHLVSTQSSREEPSFRAELVVEENELNDRLETFEVDNYISPVSPRASIVDVKDITVLFGWELAVGICGYVGPELGFLAAELAIGASLFVDIAIVCFGGFGLLSMLVCLCLSRVVNSGSGGSGGNKTDLIHLDSVLRDGADRWHAVEGHGAYGVSEQKSFL